MQPSGVLRIQRDAGLLTNLRMSVEVGVGLAHLTGRRLWASFDQPIPPAPTSSIPVAERGRPATVLDLFEIPVPIVHGDELPALDAMRTDRIDWPDFAHAVCVVDGDIDLDDPTLMDFANGRSRLVRPPDSDAPVVSISGRPLTFYSYFFHASPPTRRGLHSIIRGVRPRRPYAELAARIASDLGRFNAVHLRRSDLTIGIPAYGAVTAETLAEGLADIMPLHEPLVVCSEVNGNDELFDPFRQRFSDIVFASDLVLDDHRSDFRSLPRHEDNALGVITQEIATRAQSFVGTIGSTFTAVIQRQRLFRDPNERFLYTADYTPTGPVFRRGEYVETADGCYSWNRLGYAMSPDVLAWFREWPESVW